MFNEKYDDIRSIISSAQTNVAEVCMVMNSVNPIEGGPGMTTEQLHEVVGRTAAEVHNIAFALGNLVDIIEQDHPTA